MKEFDKIIKAIKNLGWSVTVEENDFNLQKFSPAGQDFNIEIIADNVTDFINAIRERRESFDISYETYIWLDNTGHGVNGAPYDMRDLYNDMEACLEMMKELLDEIEQVEFDD